MTAKIRRYPQRSAIRHASVGTGGPAAADWRTSEMRADFMGPRRTGVNGGRDGRRNTGEIEINFASRRATRGDESVLTGDNDSD